MQGMVRIIYSEGTFKGIVQKTLPYPPPGPERGHIIV